MPLVNFRKKISLLFLRFSSEFRKSNIFAVAEHTRNHIFWRDIQKIFFQNVHFGPIRRVHDGFSRFVFFIVQICIFIWNFWVIFENYSMRMLSIHGNGFIAHWAYKEMISSNTEHKPNEFSRMLSQRKNINSFYMYSYAEHTRKGFYCNLSIRGNDLNAGWAYEEMISLLTEHTRKCLKVEYLSRIEYNFLNYRVTGPRDYKDSVSAKKY